MSAIKGLVELKQLGDTEFQDNPLYAVHEDGTIVDLANKYSVAKPIGQDNTTDVNTRNGL